MRGKSNAEVLDAKLERIDSYLLLGRVNPNSSLQCSDISPTEIALSAGKDKFMSNLCNLWALRIKLSGLKTAWKDSTSGFLLVWDLLVTIIS